MNIFVKQILWNVREQVGLQVEVLELSEAVQGSLTDHLNSIVVEGQPEQLLEWFERLELKSIQVTLSLSLSDFMTT